MNELNATYFLYLAALLFSVGIFIVLSKRNAVVILIGVELILNGANLLLATFSRDDLNYRGQIISVFSVVLTVCEISIALAILLNVYRQYMTSDLDELQEVGNE